MPNGKYFKSKVKNYPENVFSTNLSTFSEDTGTMIGFLCVFPNLIGDFECNEHCVKIVQIRAFSGPYLDTFRVVNV